MKKLLILLCMLALLAIAPMAQAQTVLPLPPQLRADELAGKTAAAWLGAYDAADGRLAVTLCEPEVFAADDIYSLEPGDIVLSRGMPYTVQTITQTPDWLVINAGEYEFSEGSLWLSANEEGDFMPMFYEDHVWQKVIALEFPLAADFVFLDGIDPQTGEPLSEPARYGATDFLRILREETANEGVGFATGNVTLTFDDAGAIAQIVRFYVPWQ